MDNLKIEKGYLSKKIVTLKAINDLKVDKVRTFEEKYCKIKYNFMIFFLLDL